MTQVIGRSLAQVWILAFVAVFGTFLVELVPALRLAVVLLYGLPLLGVAVLRLRGGADWLDLSVLVALGAHAVVSVAGADTVGSLATLALALAYAVLFWLMRRLTDADQRSVVAVPVATALVGWVAIAAVVWLLEKASWIAAGGGVPPLPSVQGLAWATTNAYPVLVILAVPFVAAVADSPVRRVLVIALVVAGVVAVPLSDGRAGWLGLAVGAAAYGVVGGWSRRIGPLVVGGALVAVGLMVFGGRLGSVVASGLDARLRLWDQALAVFGADPLTGSGPGTFAWMRLARVADYADPIGVTAAHNVPLQTLADGGLLLFVAFAVVALVWAIGVWRRRWTMMTVERLAAASVIGLAAASMLDDFSYLPAVMAAGVTLAAWSVPVSRSQGAPERRPVLLAGLLAVAVVAAIPLVAAESARLAASSGRAFTLEGRWHDAADAFARATAFHPTNPLNQLGLGLANAELGEVDQARDAYTSIVPLSPGDPRVAGALAAMAEDPALQAQLLDMAARRSTDPQYAVRLSAVLADLGRNGEAAEAYALAVMLRTDLYGLLDGSGVSREAVRAALPVVGERVSALETDRLERVLWDVGLADGSPPDGAPAAWGAVAASVRGDTAAADSLLADARDAAPRNRFTHLAAAAVARIGCDEVAYRRAMTLARLAGADAATSVAPLAVGRDPIYRDLGLGDYQPSWVERPPAPEPWPFGLIEAPECGWTP